MNSTFCYIWKALIISMFIDVTQIFIQVKINLLLPRLCFDYYFPVIKIEKYFLEKIISWLLRRKATSSIWWNFITLFQSTLLRFDMNAQVNLVKFSLNYNFSVFQFYEKMVLYNLSIWSSRDNFQKKLLKYQSLDCYSYPFFRMLKHNKNNFVHVDCSVV